ncbi:hypothetical protein NHX12_018777 [Muraenolepis orangiensis]|uniref:Peptidase C31 domain-containing protein n=1 Tax=Muraenolepis orangiensis TaxID=630683 RepID=A0A9Q0EXE6_9TELE|nr:hypothetical protein NHX12_018777 [Muraenolepis orangiensis]
MFPSEQTRVAYVVSLRSGMAREWGTAMWEADSPCCVSFKEFSDEMKQILSVEEKQRGSYFAFDKLGDRGAPEPWRGADTPTQATFTIITAYNLSLQSAELDRPPEKKTENRQSDLPSVAFTSLLPDRSCTLAGDKSTGARSAGNRFSEERPQKPAYPILQGPQGPLSRDKRECPSWLLTHQSHQASVYI